MKILSAVYFNAGNDNNGNPRHGWIVLTANGKYHCVNAGYEGFGALCAYGFTPGECKAIIRQSISLNISPKEYRQILKTAAKNKKTRNNE